MISYSLHNPPRPSPRSSWQADEITASNRQQRQRVMRILNSQSFYLSRWTFTVRQSRKLLWFEVCGFFIFLTCFCLVTRSQSSTSQGLSSSGIFTFTSTRLANISSWTHGITEQWEERDYGLICVDPAGLQRSNVINDLPALVPHMNWKQELDRGMVSPEGKENQRNQRGKQILARPLDEEACFEGSWSVCSTVAT